MNASVLAVGTELTSGQIINKNAATISERLKKLGIITVCHLTVPDDRKTIMNSLQYLEQQSDLIFVTGGLGPTSDDFTRDLIAEWSQLAMRFDESSWKAIQERLAFRGFQVKEMQRQQCYFPEGATILTNKEGTANAFYLQLKKASGLKDVFVLPGPPREIDAVWNDHIQSCLLEKSAHLNKLITRSWDTLGVGESDVATAVEAALKERPADEFFEIGYRVHHPYVEVKISFQEKQEKFFSAWIQKVETALRDITVARDFEDVVDVVTKKLSPIDFTFYDFITQGFLHSRLSPSLKQLKNWSFKQSEAAVSADFFENEDQFLALLPYEENKCLVLFSLNENLKQKVIEAPMKSSLMAERRKQYFTEMALLELKKYL